MARSLFRELMKYITMPMNDTFERVAQDSAADSLKMKVMIITPKSQNETCQYADFLQNEITLIIEYSFVDNESQQTMHAFLDGVCYVIGGSCQRVSAKVFMYMPSCTRVICDIRAVTGSVGQICSFDRVKSVRHLSRVQESHR